MCAVLGVDFDNTVVSYDDVIHRVAVEMGLIPERPIIDRLEARRLIRQHPNGEIAWQCSSHTGKSPSRYPRFAAAGWRCNGIG